LSSDKITHDSVWMQAERMYLTIVSSFKF